MPDIRTDEIGTQLHHRSFLQVGGPRPGKPVSYAGQDAQYLSLTGVSNPESGGIDPVWVPDPRVPKRFRLVGRSISAPDLPSATITYREKHGAVPRSLLRNSRFSVYEVAGKCKDPSDFTRGWSSYVHVYEDGEVTDKDEGDRSTFDSDDPIEDALTVVFANIYPIGALGFGEGAATQIDREVVDLVFMSGDPCAGVLDFGDQRLYVLAQASGAGSPGLPAEVVYTTDGGATWNQTNIDGLGATESVYAIDVVGQFLVVIGTDAYYFSEVNQKTGVPGAWTKVTTGFVAAKSPRDLYVASPREVFFCGLGGYIYKSTDITAGVSVLNAGVATSSDLLRIHGSGDTLVSSGASGAIVKSPNRGQTWAATTVSPENTSLQALEVVDDDIIWVGTSTGRVWSTDNGGESWVPRIPPGLSGGAVYDIVFPTYSVGYISWSNSTPTAKLYATWNGGNDWSNAAPRVLNYPVFDRGNRIATPATDDPGWASNTIGVGGLAGDGTDGIALVGTVSKI